MIEDNDGFKKKEDTMSAMMKQTRPCTISESIIQSCKEVKMMREGKLRKKTWAELVEEMKSWDTEDGE